MRLPQTPCYFVNESEEMAEINAGKKCVHVKLASQLTARSATKKRGIYLKLVTYITLIRRNR